MAHFISVVETPDNSVHFVNVDHLVQIVHVPNAAVATLTTSDGKTFRVTEAEFKNFVHLFSQKAGAAPA